LVAPVQPCLLAGSDARLMQEVQRQLAHGLGQALHLCSLDALRDDFGAEGDGPLLLAAVSPADADAITALIQDIQLQRLPCRVGILECDRTRRNLAAVDPHVAGRWTWPAQADVVASWLQRESSSGKSGPCLADPLQREISRRLLRYTPSLAPLVEALALAAAHSVTVLVDGETGTGKTFLARLIHDCSPRAAARFVVVPCGALAPNLVESEFFGHVKGAFTGADMPKIGKFAVAGQGTLLLDEIDSLGLEQQANLLRVIETGEFEPVGSNETQICAARIIAATNCNLEEAVDQGRFRRDLYYRLNVMPFYLPPLRDRIDDIAPLARGMVARFNAKFHKGLYTINSDVIALLEAFPWPGNIRQLENIVQQAVLLSSGTELLVKHLSALVQNYFLERSDPPRTSRLSLVRKREESERGAIQRALEESNHSRTRAAQALGVSRVTLYKKMKKYGLLAKPLPGDWERDEPARIHTAIA
jgi:two-component system response regulator HydG